MRAPRIGRDSLWRNRDFNLLWTSESLSGLGTAMTGLAYPLVVLALTGSAVAAGAVGTAALIVGIVLRLPLGVLVDRVDRRRLMIACDAIRLVAFVALGVALLTGYGSLPLVLAVALVESACSAAFSNAALTAVRNLVPVEQVPTAVARNEARQHGVSLVGPPLGGVAYSLGRAVPFLADALSYLLSLTGLLLIRRPMQQAERPAPGGSPLRELVEGLRFTFTEPFLRATMLIAAPLNFAINGIVFAIILLLQRNGTPPALIGTVETIIGVGGLVGAFIAGPLGRRFSVPQLVRGICVLGVPFILAVFPLAAGPAAAAPVALLILLSPALNAALFGYLAVVTPDHLLGRAMSALMTAAMGLTSLAPIAAGLLVNHFGAAGPAVGFALAMAVSSAVALSAKGIRTVRPTAPASADSADTDSAPADPPSADPALVDSAPAGPPDADPTGDPAGSVLR